MDDKIIISNRSALLAKYGSKGLAAINKALTTLKSADKQRGIDSRVVYLDDAAMMKKLGGKAVSKASNRQENKAAVDVVFGKLMPDYLMILGAHDVVPHQDIANPAFDPEGEDDDRYAWSDLPYACDVSYSRDPARFVGPTRVVGRLPDLVSAHEPSYLIALLKTAARYKRRAPKDYAAYFGLSAAVWEGSSRMSLENAVGNSTGLRLSPAAGPRHPPNQLRARTHFINCHGGESSPEFQGEKGEQYFSALTTATLADKITEGTVAVAECCYGAQLYDALTLVIDLPICQSYLRQGAYGYFGSTTIAYGPEDDNGQADLVCQYFLRNVLAGASLGRAALMARQEFVANTGQMDPVDLKTLAQFYLLGDPSIHPVAGAAEPKQRGDTAERFLRAERRAKLTSTGEFLGKTKPTASRPAKNTRVAPAARAALGNLAKLAGLNETQAFKAFAVKGGAVAKTRGTKKANVPTRYHLAIGASGKPSKDGFSRGVAIVAKELSGHIVDYRIYYQH